MLRTVLRERGRQYLASAIDSFKMSSTTKRKHSETCTPNELYDLCYFLRFFGRSDESFDRIRQWLNNNKDDSNIFTAAAAYQGENNHTPLAWLCQANPPLDIIQTLLEYAPDSAQIQNSIGYTPLHLVCACESSLEVVQALVNSYPEGLKVTNCDGELPLHSACLCGQSLTIINFLIDSYPEGMYQKTNDDRRVVYCFGSPLPPGSSPLDHYMLVKFAEYSDDSGMLPLHHACKNGYSLYLIHFLIQAYPEGSTVPDHDGKTPFQYWNETASQMDEQGMTLLHRQAAHSKGLCVGALPFLVNAFPEATRLQDKSGLLPIHHACVNEMSSVDALMLLIKLHPECLVV